jgi:hypothetical protein
MLLSVSSACSLLLDTKALAENQGGESGGAIGAARGGTAGAGTAGYGGFGNGGIGGNTGVGGSSAAGDAGAGGQGGVSCDRTLTFDAVSLLHDTGGIDEDGWGAFPEQHDAGLLGYLRVANVSNCNIVLQFRTLVTSAVAADTRVMDIGFFDITANDWLVQRSLRGEDLLAVGRIVTYVLDPFSIPEASRAHDFQFNVYWHDTVHLKLIKVEVTLTP